jgi:hypothetical protein
VVFWILVNKSKIGRNAPCPCGSGLKYKKCCLQELPKSLNQYYNCRKENRYIPSGVRRIVRQSANFGCAKCGCPLIEYHHIKPFHEVLSHDPDNMVALCPNCHRRADEGGPWSPQFVDQFRLSPYNKDVLKDKFEIGDSDFSVKCGTLEFPGDGDVIRLQNMTVLTINRNLEGIIRVDSRFFNEQGEMIAYISDNEWGVLIDRIWDVEYASARNLKVWSSSRNIMLELEITDQILNIKNCIFQYRGSVFISKTMSSGVTKVDIKDSSGKTHFHSEDERVIFAPGSGLTVN